MKRVISLFVVISLTIAVISGCSGKPDESVEATNIEEVSRPVEVVTPEKRDIAISNALSGKLSATEDIAVVSELSPSPKVKDLRVQVGDRVKKGEVLFVLDDENIKDQIEQLQASYDASTWNIKNTEEKLQNAKTDLERMEKLYEAGAITDQALEQARLAASDTSLNGLKAQVKQSKVSLDQAISKLQDTVITAPITGYVVDVNIDENEFPPTGSAAMRIVNTDKLTVDVGVAERIVNKISKGQEVDVRIKVATDDTLKGIVKTVSPIPDQASQVYPVEIEIDNKDGSIKAGMFAEIIFDIEKQEDVLSIPSDAIIENDNGKYVYVVENDTAKVKEIEVGLDNGEYTEIASGISESDNVVIKGHDYVEDGEKVNIVRGDK